MWTTVLEIAGAWIARLAPNTPPALWLPFAGYAATAAGALLIAFTVRVATGSRLAAGAAAIAFVATPAGASGPFGLLALALALAGACFTPGLRPSARAVVLVVVAAAALTPAGRVLVWILVGCGLAIVARTVGAPHETPARFRAIAIVAVLTLVLIAARRPEAATSVPPPPKPLGHDRVTAASFRALLSNLPPGSALVRDDAITAMLFRANRANFQRARVDITEIDNDAAAIRETLKTRRVFALPYAQQDLSLQGFEVVDSLRAADRGLAEVRAGGDCVTASHLWQDAPSLAAHPHLALVASDGDHRGPVVIYLIGADPIRVDAINWPARTLRGFAPRTFDLSNAQDRKDLELEQTEDQGPGTLDLAGRSSVTRVALWRMPDSAMSIEIGLSSPATRVAVQLAPEATGAVSVCPAFPSTVSPIR